MYTLLILFFVLAIGFSFLCSLWEAVLLSITPSFAQIKQQEGTKLGARLQSFKENIDRPLSAILTLNTGLTIHQLPKIEPLLRKAQIALTRGFIELGDLERADEVFASIKGVQSPQLREVQGALLSKKAQNALIRGDYGRARTLIDQAKAIVQDDTELLLADRKLLLSENLAVVVVLVLLLPAFALAVVLYIRKRLDSARMRRLALEIDRAPSTSTHDTSA